MSDLESVFDTLRGWPKDSALEASFEPQAGVTLAAGRIVVGANRNFGTASVLKIVNDALVTAPTLTYADRGKAYEIAGVGGAWSVFTAGDIVEWDGTDWVLIVAQSGGNPPNGTRAIVVGASAAGSFTGLENQALVCTSGTWASRDLADAVVLRMVDDTLVTAPAVTSADAGKAYMCAGVGGAWSGFTIGDIVEWDGATWNLVLAGVGAEPPNGTRAVVVEASAAGSFAGAEEQVWSYSTGTSTWTAATTPVAGNRIQINGGVAGASVYDSRYYQYNGSNWVFAAGLQTTIDTPVNGSRVLISDADSVYADQYWDYDGTSWKKVPLFGQKAAAAYMAPLYSGLRTVFNKDQAWLVIEGNDQTDAQFTGVITCLKLQSGVTFQLQHDAANTLVPGTYVEAVNGVLQAYTDKHPVGIVVETNGVAGSDGIIAVASM